MQDRTLTIERPNGDRQAFTVAPDATVKMNNNVISAPTDGSNAGHGGELGALVGVTNFKTDANNNLLAKDGSILTKAVSGSLAWLYDDAQALIDDAARLAFPNEIKIDGEIHHQGLPPTTFYGSVADGPNKGKLKHMDGVVVVPPVVILPPTDPGKAILVDRAWPDPTVRNIKLRSNGFGALPLIERFTIPTTVKPSNEPCRYRIAEVPGTTVTNRHVKLTVNDKVRSEGDGGTSPVFDFTVGGSGASYDFAPGDVVQFETTNPGLPAGTTADVLTELWTNGR